MRLYRWQIIPQSRLQFMQTTPPSHVTTVSVCSLPPPPLPVSVQLVTVHLVDSQCCSDAGKFISVLLTSLSAMVQVELPHVNVLSKIDLIEQYDKLGGCGLAEVSCVQGAGCLDSYTVTRSVLRLECNSVCILLIYSNPVCSIQPGLLHRGS